MVKPYGKLYYLNNPNTDEYGYEGYVDWYPNDNDEEGLDVFIDADTPDTTEAGLCLARFEKLWQGKKGMGNPQKPHDRATGR